jgi:putative redox protein
MSTKPPTRVSVRWTDGLAFVSEAHGHQSVSDGDSRTGLSPVELLGASLASCMGSDLALILTRGRQDLRALDVDLVADRDDHDPYRFLRIRIHFAVRGEVSQAHLDRAIALSHEKYCSVWHSMRQDVPLELTSSIAPA